MKTLTVFLSVLAIGSIFSSRGLAQEFAAPTEVITSEQPPADYPIVKGVVRRVTAATGKVSVKHEEIPNLNMPAMTMTFAVAKPEMLDGLVAGTKIQFCADEINGELTLIWLEPEQ